MRALLRLAALLPLLSTPLAAQDSTGALRLRGITFDYWEGAAGPVLLRPTLRATNLSRGGLGSEFGLTLFPDGISLDPPAITVGPQASLAYRFAVGPVSLLPKAGGAAILVAVLGGERPLYLVPGVQFGIGMLVPLDAKSLFRVDLARHLYSLNGHNVGFWSVGFGFATPRRAKR